MAPVGPRKPPGTMMASSFGSEAGKKTAWGTVFPPNADDVGAPLDLAVHPFQRVGRGDPGPMLAREFAPVREAANCPEDSLRQ